MKTPLVLLLHSSAQVLQALLDLVVLPWVLSLLAQLHWLLLSRWLVLSAGSWAWLLLPPSLS